MPESSLEISFSLQRKTHTAVRFCFTLKSELLPAREWAATLLSAREQGLPLGFKLQDLLGHLSQVLFRPCLADASLGRVLQGELGVRRFARLAERI